MTVAELRKALEGVPDDLVVVTNDSGGYPQEAELPEVMTGEKAFGRYIVDRDPSQMFLVIC